MAERGAGSLGLPSPWFLLLSGPEPSLGTCFGKFESGEDITKYLDVSKAHRPEQKQRRVNVDFPIWMIHSLDKEAKRLGVPRQSIIKVWVAERLEEKKKA